MIIEEGYKKCCVINSFHRALSLAAMTPTELIICITVTLSLAAIALGFFVYYYAFRGFCDSTKCHCPLPCGCLACTTIQKITKWDEEDDSKELASLTESKLEPALVIRSPSTTIIPL
jgi:hypothetical protein